MVGNFEQRPALKAIFNRGRPSVAGGPNRAASKTPRPPGFGNRSMRSQASSSPGMQAKEETPARQAERGADWRRAG